MVRTSLSLALLSAIATQALAAGSVNMHVEGIGADSVIAENYALCKATKDGKSEPGKNIRPEISWSGAPAETKSYVLVVVDPDVPADFSKAGKDGQIVEKAAPRQDFYHWALVDIPPSTTKIGGGDATIAPTIGKALPNDLGGYIADPKNFGGPCPPWNDERLHHYHFKLLALDVKSLKLNDKATAKDVLKAAKPHILAEGEKIGTYTLNAALLKQ